MLNYPFTSESLSDDTNEKNHNYYKCKDKFTEANYNCKVGAFTAANYS